MSRFGSRDPFYQRLEALEAQARIDRVVGMGPLKYGNCGAPAKQTDAPAKAPDLEDALEEAFWNFDQERTRTGAERDAFKGQVRRLVRLFGQQQEAQP